MPHDHANHLASYHAATPEIVEGAIKDALAAKEAVGKATDNEQLEAEGKGDQVSSDVKSAGEKIKDAFKH